MNIHALALALVTLSLPAAAEAPPEWIWSGAEPAEGEQVWFVRDFELGEPARGLVLATCDNRFTLWLDGKELTKGKDWQRLESGRATLDAGTHRLAVAAANTGGPAGFILRLMLELESGGTEHVDSDGEWWCTSEAPAAGWKLPGERGEAWTPARSLGRADEIEGPWPDPFTPRVATAPEAITAPEGFVVELLRSAQLGEGSWVCMTFDPQGCVVLSPQWGPLRRITLAKSGETKLETLSLPVSSAQGLLFAFDSFYVVSSTSIKEGGGLYRLRDTDGDGDFDDEVTLLEPFGPKSEHGAHAIIEGLDGMLYTVHGNYTNLPELAETSPHRDYAEDLLLPRLWDPGGHAVNIKAPGCRVLRTDPNGEEWELFAAGMRNAYDLAFDRHGELFTYDSDMEWDVGSPWYRAPKLFHVVSGGEYGWRSGTAKWPAHTLDALPALADTDLASPTGVVFGKNASFPTRYREALFVGDWAYGRILAVHLDPLGASFDAEVETFLTGKPLPVTDFEVGPDGALYFITGGRGTQSGLYRVSYEGKEDTTLPEVGERSPDAIERRWLEERHRVADPQDLQRILAGLGHRDRFVRHAARVALERLDPGTWQEEALAVERWPAQLYAWMAISRKGDTAARTELVHRVVGHPHLILNRDRLLHSLRVLTVAFSRGATPDFELRGRLAERLLRVYPTGKHPLDRELLEMLVFVQAPGLLERGLARLANDELPAQEQLHTALAISLIEEGWDEDAHRTAWQAWLERAQDLKGGRSFGGFLKKMDERARMHWPAEALEAPEPAPSEPAPSLPDAAGRLWSVEELLQHEERLSAGRNFEQGKAAFAKALCLHCHRMAGGGGASAPDLTGAASRFNRRDLIEAIVSPSKDVSDQYQQLHIETKGGDRYLGRVLARTDASITLEQSPLAPTTVEIATSDIASEEPSPVSAMPENLLGILSLDEILDLLAYLESGGDPEAAAFEK